MKKTVIALAVSGLVMTSLAQAAPQEHTFYIGAKAGQVSFHDGIRAYTNSNSPELGPPLGKGYHRNSLTYGVFGGYQLLNRNNLGLAVELGYDDFGRVKFSEAGKTSFKHTEHGAHLGLKGSYDLGGVMPALNGLDIYGRAGVALVRADYRVYGSGVTESGHELKAVPVFATGFEYALPSLPALAFRVEYQWLNGVPTRVRPHYSPWAGAINAGFSYRFGQTPKTTVPAIMTKTFNLDSDVTFDFGKANLKPEAKATLDNIYNEVAKVTDVNIAVAGFTDRIGSEKSNLALSQSRADSVANYLLAKGLGTQNMEAGIVAVGYGEASPVTGKTCDDVKGHKALIACLAPDRRVEIAVSGTAKVMPSDSMHSNAMMGTDTMHKTETSMHGTTMKHEDKKAMEHHHKMMESSKTMKKVEEPAKTTAK